jgi:hypothetical protein
MAGDMMDYYCKECGTLDPIGIAGHHVRCKPVANTAPVVANEVVAKVANKHGVYKDKEARLAYMRELMRKRRQREQTQESR